MLDSPWPLVMGILNVTPDSFSDGGAYASTGAAIETGLMMAADGAAIIDVGGESTRPGAAFVDPEDERHRVLPVVAALSRAGLTVSIDTRNATTMRAALEAGARIVNDVSALTHDPDAAGVVADARCPVILMHMRGTPATMQTLAHYPDVIATVTRELLQRRDAALAAGIAPENIVLDPGIGFAKTALQNIELLRRTDAFAALGHPVLVGASRKGFLGGITGQPRAADRLAASLAAALIAAAGGAAILRVHDVAETVHAIAVWRAVTKGAVAPHPPVG